MEKVFISFVGFNDPFGTKNNSEGSILTMANYLKPEHVILLPSSGSDSTEKNAKETKEILEEKEFLKSCIIKPLGHINPVDFKEISIVYEKILNSIFVEYGHSNNGREYCFNCTSGTPQMTAMAYATNSSKQFKNISLWQCVEDRHAINGDRVFRINTNFLEEKSLIKNIREEIKDFNFSKLRLDCQTLSSISINETRALRAAVLSEIANAYEHLDVLRYDVSLNIFNINLPKFSIFDLEVSSALCEQKKVLESLSNHLAPDADKSRETAVNLTELFFNMQRSLRRGAYADVLARFWRLAEGSTYFILQNKHGINPREIESSKDAEKLKIIKDRAREVDIYIDNHALAFYKSKIILTKILHDENALKFFNIHNDNKTKEIIRRRNNSIVGHGMDPVTKEDAEKCISVANSLLTTLAPETSEIVSNYAFKPKIFRQIFATLEEM